MSRRTTNALLMAGLVASLVVAWIRPGDTRRRNFEYFPDMARSPRYNTFAANPIFTDGKTLQPPVANTVPVDDAVPASSQGGSDSASQTGAATTNPFPPTDAAALARGKTVFTTFCQPCHGAGGDGDGLIPAHGFPAVPSLVRGTARTMNDVRIFRIVTRGSSDMPSYASQISPGDRWKAILYVRTLQGRPAAPPAAGSRGSQ